MVTLKFKSHHENSTYVRPFECWVGNVQGNEQGPHPPLTLKKDSGFNVFQTEVPLHSNEFLYVLVT